MAGLRFYGTRGVFTQKFPEWQANLTYPESSVVWENDSESITYFLCLSSHISNDSDSRLGVPLWTPLLSNNTEVIDSENSAASLNFKINHFRDSIDSDKRGSDSEIIDMKALVEYIKQNLTQANLDSDINSLKSRATLIESEKIIQFTDSDSRHLYVISWDSDLNEFVTSQAALKINNNSPDDSGFVNLSMQNILVGTRDEQPDSDDHGTMFVVSNDSEAIWDGTSYIFNTEGPSLTRGWIRVIGKAPVTRDLRYLNKDGETRHLMTGPLKTTTFVPVDDSEAASIGYFKSVFDPTHKDNKNISFDSDATVDLSTFDSDTFFNTNKSNLKWFDGSVFHVINENVSPSSQPSIVSVTSTSGTNTESLLFTTSKFSNFIDIKLTASKDGVSIPHAYVLNCSGDSAKMKITDQLDQSFTISIAENFNIGSSYSFVFETHLGYQLILSRVSGSVVWVINNETDNISDFGTF